ncbi:SWIM zinc finger family protein, partial [Streptomyces rochei]|uniref:SWIM zinc finger family protein n=1 Tax=Streptomyces rochei TaxID=1928 RepID=UPI0036A95711
MTPRPADEARRALREARDLTGAGKGRAAATGEDVDTDADAVTDAVTEPGIGEDAPVTRSPEQARARVADPHSDFGPDSDPGPGPERDRDGVHDREPSGRRDGQEPGGAPERDPGPQPGRERARGRGPGQGEERGHGPHVAQGRDQDHTRGRGGVPAQDETQADGEAQAQAQAADHGPGGSRPPSQGQGQGRDEERGEGAERSGPRPGDIAREALRNARTARRATGQPDAPSGALSAPPGEREAEDDRSEEGTRPAQQVTPDGTAVIDQTDGSGRSDRRSGRPADARPGDAAREALRAARRQARSGPTAGGTATSRRPDRSARAGQRTGGSRTADARARAVREFIADAFRLPPEADAAVDEPSPGRTTSPGEPPLTGKPADAAPGDQETAPAATAVPPTRPAPSDTPPLQHRPAATEAERPPAPETDLERAPTRAPDWERAPAPDPERAPAPAPERAPAPARSAHRPAHAASHPTPHREPYGESLTSPRSEPPARPRAPRSMAAPDRDGELRRTFPALPPRPSGQDGFAETWWGNAWVDALEEGALDSARLARGRVYAERGTVDAITVTPGLVLAYVQGSRPRPYRVQVRLRTLGDGDWEAFLDAAVERLGHIAALLDKELPHSLADCGVPLLPGPGDLAPQCSCPDSGHPCKHAAALCYQTARLLDADPFVLLLLRGRGERTLLDDLSRRNAARSARAAQDRGR